MYVASSQNECMNTKQQYTNFAKVFWVLILVLEFMKNIEIFVVKNLIVISDASKSCFACEVWTKLFFDKLIFCCVI